MSRSELLRGLPSPCSKRARREDTSDDWSRHTAGYPKIPFWLKPPGGWPRRLPRTGEAGRSLLSRPRPSRWAQAGPGALPKRRDRSPSAIVVAPISRTIRDIAPEVRLGSEQVWQRECAASCDNLLTVPKVRLKAHRSRTRSSNWTGRSASHWRSAI